MINATTIKPGDIIVGLSSFCLCSMGEVTKVNPGSIEVRVIYGADTKQPLTIYKAAYEFYQKVES